jgi:hypothetical protein
VYELRGYPIDFDLRRRRLGRRNPHRFLAVIASAARLSAGRRNDDFAGDGLTDAETPRPQRET